MFDIAQQSVCKEEQETEVRAEALTSTTRPDMNFLGGRSKRKGSGKEVKYATEEPVMVAKIRADNDKEVASRRAKGPITPTKKGDGTTTTTRKTMLNKREIKRFKREVEEHPAILEQNFSPDELQYLWKEWLSMQISAKGHGSGMTQEEWGRSLDITLTNNKTLFDDLFRAVDTKKDNLLDFEEYVTTVALTTRCTLDEKLALTFRLLDRDGDNSMQQWELSSIVMEVGGFLALVHRGVALSSDELNAQKDKAIEEIFRDQDNIDVETFKQRAMNNTVIINCFGLFEYVFAPIVRKMDIEIGMQKKIFQRDLGDLLRHERRHIPAIIQQSIAFLETCLEQEGLFRLSGNSAELMAVKDAYDKSGGDGIVLESYSPHVIADILKTFLRELPEPLLTYAHYESFLQLHTIDDERTFFLKLRALVASLPQANLAVLKYLVTFLAKVKKQHRINRMDYHNLATVFAPIILRRKDEGDPKRMMQESKSTIFIVKQLLKHHKALFKEITDDSSEEELEDKKRNEEALKFIAEGRQSMLDIFDRFWNELQAKNEEIVSLKAKIAELKRELSVSRRNMISSGFGSVSVPDLRAHDSDTDDTDDNDGDGTETGTEVVEETGGKVRSDEMPSPAARLSIPIIIEEGSQGDASPTSHFVESNNNQECKDKDSSEKDTDAEVEVHPPLPPPLPSVPVEEELNQSRGGKKKREKKERKDSSSRSKESFAKFKGIFSSQGGKEKDKEREAEKGKEKRRDKHQQKQQYRKKSEAAVPLSPSEKAEPPADWGSDQRLQGSSESMTGTGDDVTSTTEDDSWDESIGALGKSSGEVNVRHSRDLRGKRSKSDLEMRMSQPEISVPPSTGAGSGSSPLTRADSADRAGSMILIRRTTPSSASGSGSGSSSSPSIFGLSASEPPKPSATPPSAAAAAAVPPPAPKPMCEWLRVSVAPREDEESKGRQCILSPRANPSSSSPPQDNNNNVCTNDANDTPNATSPGDGDGNENSTNGVAPPSPSPSPSPSQAMNDSDIELAKSDSASSAGAPAASPKNEQSSEGVVGSDSPIGRKQELQLSDDALVALESPTPASARGRASSAADIKRPESPLKEEELKPMLPKRNTLLGQQRTPDIVREGDISTPKAASHEILLPTSYSADPAPYGKRRETESARLDLRDLRGSKEKGRRKRDKASDLVEEEQSFIRVSSPRRKKHSSSEKRRKDKDKDKEKDKEHRSKDKGKDKDRSFDKRDKRDKERGTEEKEKEKDKEREKEKRKDRDKDREKRRQKTEDSDKDKEKQKKKKSDREAERNKEEEKDSAQTKVKEKGRNRDKEKGRDREKEKEKDRSEEEDKETEKEMEKETKGSRVGAPRELERAASSSKGMRAPRYLLTQSSPLAFAETIRERDKRERRRDGRDRKATDDAIALSARHRRPSIEDPGPLSD